MLQLCLGHGSGDGPEHVGRAGIVGRKRTEQNKTAVNTFLLVLPLSNKSFLVCFLCLKYEPCVSLGCVIWGGFTCSSLTTSSRLLTSGKAASGA